jgi:hypothetical protein
MDFEKARRILKEEFKSAAEVFASDSNWQLNEGGVAGSSDIVFSSRTQAYREVLLGCALAKILDPSTNLRQPYVEQGENAFSGRTLDEKVVNPFLQENNVPCSRGPYLSVFRRYVQFLPEIRGGLKDKAGYDAFLHLLSALEALSGEEELREFTRYILLRFITLREQSDIPLSRLHRMSIEQFETLAAGLLDVRSGGRFPLFFTVALFRTIRGAFNLKWEIECQGINVSDKASGAGGDVIIREGDSILLAVEVTERPVDRARVAATFNTKIGPQGIEDYLFVSSNSDPTAEAREATRQYFAQGHEINFLRIREWMIMILATLGVRGRTLFIQEFLQLLGGKDVPAAMKIAWNDVVKSLVGST